MDALKELFTRQGPFASVAMDVSLDSESGERTLELRAREVGDRLLEQGAPAEVVDRVRGALEQPVREPAPRTRFVVATGEGVLLDEVVAEPTTQAEVVWAPLPDTARLMALQQEVTSLVLVSVDHTGGSVTTYDSRELEVTDADHVEGDEDYVQKVRGGGMAHRRFQMTSEEVWRENAREVGALALEKVRAGERLVVVAGSAESRGEVVDALSSSPAEVVTLDRAGLSSDGGEESLHLALRAVVEQHLEEEREALRARLEQALGQDRGATAELEDVLDAFVKGQVETLVLDRAAMAEETVIAANHPGLELPGEMPLRADLALVACAVRTDANVVEPPHGFVQPVAALLRWDDDPGVADQG